MRLNSTKMLILSYVSYVLASTSVQLPVPGSLAIKDLTLTYKRISILVEVKRIVRSRCVLSQLPSCVIKYLNLFSVYV